MIGGKMRFTMRHALCLWGCLILWVATGCDEGAGAPSATNTAASAG